jgi:hypothetical protein
MGGVDRNLPRRSLRSVGASCAQDDPAVATSTTGTAVEDTACAAFAAFAAVAEKPHCVAAGTARAASAKYRLSAGATVTAVAGKEPAVATRAAWASVARCTKKAAASSSGATVSNYLGVPACIAGESHGLILLISAPE